MMGALHIMQSGLAIPPKRLLLASKWCRTEIPVKLANWKNVKDLALPMTWMNAKHVTACRARLMMPHDGAWLVVLVLSLLHGR